MAIKIDEIKFSKLIEKNKIKLYAVAKSILKNEDDVYDALQEALLSMYKNIDNLNEPKYFSTWATRIVINKCYDLIRQNSRKENIDVLEEQEETVFTEDTYDLDTFGIQKAIGELKEDIRLITILYYYNDVSVKEIAKQLNIPVGTVKTKLATARKILKEKLKMEDE